tara:strand:+ start:442 stop:633 length:192 start_codon:yes stop_codon:yes gene_type:complete
MYLTPALLSLALVVKQGATAAVPPPGIGEPCSTPTAPDNYSLNINNATAFSLMVYQIPLCMQY